jgi:hypothetical protein
MPRPSNTSWLDHSNYTLIRVQVMKLPLAWTVCLQQIKVWSYLIRSR